MSKCVKRISRFFRKQNNLFQVAAKENTLAFLSREHFYKQFMTLLFLGLLNTGCLCKVKS
jgi:hypothetical protein